MKISATSALVLNWTDPHIWKSGKAREYFNNLDLSEAEELLEEFSSRENYMHLQSVSNRKFFIRKKCVEYLTENPNGQILFFGAGISPMSIELAEFFPEAKIFDIDKYLMNEKRELVNDSVSNIKFIECDISDIENLKKDLNKNSFEEKEFLGVFEGITYYLKPEHLKKLFMFCKSLNAGITGDFGLKPEIVDSHNRIFGVDVFDKIKNFVKGTEVNFYTPDEFKSLIIESGFKEFNRFKFDAIQTERTGIPQPFEGNEPGWISMFTAK